MGHGQLDSVLGPYTKFQESIFTHLTCLKIPVQVTLGKLKIGRTGGAVCKVSYSLARATGRLLVQAPAAILARLGNIYLLKSLIMSLFTVLLCSINGHEYNQSGLGAVHD
jgi:hypothetical protein